MFFTLLLLTKLMQLPQMALYDFYEHSICVHFNFCCKEFNFRLERIHVENTREKRPQ